MNDDNDDMIQPYSDEYFMKSAFQQAISAFEKKEVPVGAVIVSKNKIIARAHNLTEQLGDVTAHAEMQAITPPLPIFLGSKYLNKCCTLYVTLEPCVNVCRSTLAWSQIGRSCIWCFEIPRVDFLKHETPKLLHPKTDRDHWTDHGKKNASSLMNLVL